MWPIPVFIGTWTRSGILLRESPALTPLPPVDLNLARRLERTEALANAAFVDARAEVDPAAGATWIEVAGVYAMYDGVGSPLTQTFGLGLFASCLAPEFDQLEAFFDARGASTCHEVSSFAPGPTVTLLSARRYVPIEESAVLIRGTAADSLEPASGITVRHVSPSETAEWARVSGEGWSSEGAALAAFVEQFGRVTARARGTSCFIAEKDGRPIAAAALFLGHDVALLAGASTVPGARRQGAQGALLRERLGFAADRGVKLAMVVAQPHSASCRNAERQGFHQVYSRRKWERRPGQ